jgi:Holliday junction resolvase
VTHYARGAERERELAKLWRSDGWQVFRSAGSHSPADLICLKRGHEPRLLQLKTGRRRWPSRDERVALSVTAKAGGALPLIVFWQPRQKPEYVLEGDWP